MRMRLCLIFLDGVGLGDDDPAHNPLVAVPTPTITGLLGHPLADGARSEGRPAPELVLAEADATLGLPGLPQSATGQTALLTGLNAAAVVGRHVTAHPTAALRTLLAEQSLFARARAAGRGVALANAYTPEYHAGIAAGRLRHGAFTVAALGAAVPLRTVDDLRRGEAVFHDLTNGRPRGWGHDLPLRTPAEAGTLLAAIAARHDLTVFEFFLSDLAAHGRIPEDVPTVVRLIDGLLAGLLAARPADLTVLVTSDHGNLEDGRTRLHTRNPVPVLAVGPAARTFAQVAAITDIAPAVLRVLGVEAGTSGDLPGAAMPGPADATPSPMGIPGGRPG